MSIALRKNIFFRPRRRHRTPEPERHPWPAPLSTHPHKTESKDPGAPVYLPYRARCFVMITVIIVVQIQNAISPANIWTIDPSPRIKDIITLDWRAGVCRGRKANCEVFTKNFLVLNLWRRSSVARQILLKEYFLKYIFLIIGVVYHRWCRYGAVQVYWRLPDCSKVC